MATTERVAGVESVVSRWVVDYYSFLALEFFRYDRHADFCAVRDVLDIVLGRPLESTDDMALKIRVLQFLSRINEGENLDLQFENDQPITPLESALSLLENMIEEFSISQEDCETVCASIKEMIVGLFIKNSEFDKAKETLNKHFPKGICGKRAVFMELISLKSKKHDAIRLINFQQFKEEILAFCLTLCSFSTPFLQKAAKKIIEQRLAEQEDEASEIDEQDEQDEPAPPSSSPQENKVQLRPCKLFIIQRVRLEAAYKALALGSEGITFAQLEQELETEDQDKADLCDHLTVDHNRGTNLSSEQEGPCQRDVCSPMEASPADQPPQTDSEPQRQEGSLSKELYTVARLVVEPDSQPSSQCTAAPEELEMDIKTEKTPQAPSISMAKDPQELSCPVTEKEPPIPTRKRPRRTSRTINSALASAAEFSSDFEDSPLDCGGNRKMHAENLHNQSNRLLRKSKRLSDNKEDSPELLDSFKTPTQRTLEQSPRNSPTKQLDPSDVDDICITDSALDSSPNLSSPRRSVPQRSSTPHKDSAKEAGPSLSKWKVLFNNAKESKATWSDEELYFPPQKGTRSNESSISNSGYKKKMWTEEETRMLKEGVEKFGEGNWSKIKAYYSFKDRTNVNLKDRWRTLKKMNMV